MGLGKPQQLAKFEVAGFIYYGNITEFVLKIGINQNRKALYYLEKLILSLDSHTQCFLFDVTVVELRLQQMGDFFTKNRILQWTVFNFGRL